jgi:hypothetical protein
MASAAIGRPRHAADASPPQSYNILIPYMNGLLVLSSISVARVGQAKIKRCVNYAVPLVPAGPLSAQHAAAGLLEQ